MGDLAAGVGALLRAQRQRRWWRWRKLIVAGAVLLLLVLGRYRLIAEYHYLWIVADVSSGSTVGHLQDLEDLGHDGAIPPLLRMARSRDLFLRQFAAEALGRYRGPSVVDALMRLARDPDDNTQCAAIGSLGAIADPRGLPFLKEQARGNGWAVGALGNFSDSGRRALLDQLRSDMGSDARASALQTLCGSPRDGWDAFSRDAEVREEVGRRLSDPDPDVRIAAAKCVAKIGAGSTREQLRLLLQDADPMVRVSTAWELGKLGDASGFDAVSAILRNLDLPDQTRRLAALAFGDIKDPRVYRLLCDAMKSRDPYGVFDGAKVTLESLALKDPKHPVKDCPYYAPC